MLYIKTIRRLRSVRECDYITNNNNNIYLFSVESLVKNTILHNWADYITYYVTYIDCVTYISNWKTYSIALSAKKLLTWVNKKML